jgi:hypothetical protein
MDGHIPLYQAKVSHFSTKSASFAPYFAKVVALPESLDWIICIPSINCFDPQKLDVFRR